MTIALIVLSVCPAALSLDLSEAKARLSAADWGGAERATREVLAAAPGNAEASALLGFSLYHQERYADCIPILESARAGETDYAPRVLYYLGLAYAKQSRSVDSTDAFEELLVAHPESREARRVGGVGTLIDDAASERQGVDISGMYLSADMGFSSNPGLNDGGDSDAMLDVYASSDFALGTFPFLVGASLFMEKYIDQTAYDYLDISLDMHHTFEIEPDSRVAAALTMSQSWADSDAYERELSILGDWNRLWSRGWRTRLRGSVDVVSAAAASTSDGLDLKLRARAYRYCDGGGALRRVRLQFQLKEKDRDVGPDGYGSMLLGVEGRWWLGAGWTLDGGVDFETREYDGADLVTGRSRSEDIIDLSSFLMRPLREGHYLTFQAVLTTRDSNIAFFSADELRLTTGWMWVP